jgi:hypothetical protein
MAMRDLRWLALPAVMVVLAGSAGCSRVKYEKTVQIEPGDLYRFTISAPSQQQKIKIEVNSPGNPVSVYAVAAADAKDAERSLTEQDGKAPAGKLGGTDKPSETVSFEVTVPKQTELSVLIFNTINNKKATAAIKANSI